MDASEDRDLKLQRASADLLAEFGSSLTKFLWKSPPEGDQQGKPVLKVRSYVKECKTNSLIKLLEPFQEWPQLLDSHLAKFLPPLTSAFIQYLCNHRDIYCAPRRRGSTAIIPSSRGICKILYTLCKIRGEKIICRFLNNEPKFLDPMLNAFHVWNQAGGVAIDQPTTTPGPMVWEERYLMLLWLSHLMLTPFDLLSISSIEQEGEPAIDPTHVNLSPKLPPIAKRITQMCVCHLSFAGKQREAARGLLVRLALRPDMRDAGLLDSLIHWAFSSLSYEPVDGVPRPIYTYIGILSFLCGVITSADNAVAFPFLISIFEKMQTVSAQATPVTRLIFSSALARKLIIKILRSITLQALQADLLASPPQPASLIDIILEDVIDQLLTLVADSDTLVRYAASKALSVIAVKLEPVLAAEIVEAVTGNLEENILWEEVTIGATTPVDDAQNFKPTGMKRNLTAVDPLQWHGLILTLSHLIYRRSPPIKQLPKILNALILALDFEQRSSTGTSIGTSVRDAACFGIWALARRYTTKELFGFDPSAIRAIHNKRYANSLLQLISNEIVVAATLDPSGNIRRGASAALQELIGRHPDIIKEGIPLIQLVDYHAVALRSKAMLDVAIGASKLDESYRDSITIGLLGWRGLGSPDAQSRRFAATAVGILATSASRANMETIFAEVQNKLGSLHPRQIEEQHGLLLSLAAIVNEARQNGSTENGAGLCSLYNKAGTWNIFCSICPLSDRDFTSPTLRPDLTAEAACTFISALALAAPSNTSEFLDEVLKPSEANITSFLKILKLSLTRTEEYTLSVSSKAVDDLFKILGLKQRCMLVQDWVASLTADNSGSMHSSAKSLGCIAALGAVYHYFSLPNADSQPNLDQTIAEALLTQIETNSEIESRVAAIKSLSLGVFPHTTLCVRTATILKSCLEDYTVDQRGDIGSLVRLEAIDAVGSALQHDHLQDCKVRQLILGRICGLAVERLDKVRFRAWNCLRENWRMLVDIEILFSDTLPDVSSTSTTIHFEQMLSLCSFSWLRQSLLEGYVSAAGAGSDSLLRSSRLALALYAERLSTANMMVFLDCLSCIIRQNMSNDRVLVPTLVVFGFLFDAGVFTKLREIKPCWHTLVTLVQRSHYKSSNIHKLEAAVKIYTGLARVDIVRNGVLRKLCGMLLHPFPVIRNATAVALFVVTGIDELRRVGWSKPPRELKRAVQDIRRQLPREE